jgi:organic hydroperoxide reductase OsmC/OhrA
LRQLPPGDPEQVTFCLPAVALLAGAGLAALRLPARVATLALVAALVAPTQLAYRAPGGGTEAVAQFLGQHEQPGDAIVYPYGSIPPWYLAYPAAFSRLRDLSLSQTPAAAGRLNADTVPLSVLYQRERDVGRIWMPPGPWNPAVFAPVPARRQMGRRRPDSAALHQVRLTARLPEITSGQHVQERDERDQAENGPGDLGHGAQVRPDCQVDPHEDHRYRMENADKQFQDLLHVPLTTRSSTRQSTVFERWAAAGGRQPAFAEVNMPRTHSYDVTVTWTGNSGTGTSGYRAYERAHDVISGGRPVIAGSSDPMFRGDAARWNPELGLVAALSQCHMLWYLHLCAVAGVVVTSYTDEAAGTMTEDDDGSGRFTEVVLRPRVTVAAPEMIEPAVNLHPEAHGKCFIANSVNFPVRHESVITAVG